MDRQPIFTLLCLKYCATNVIRAGGVHPGIVMNSYALAYTKER
jgi:hypothetical protein